MTQPTPCGHVRRRVRAALRGTRRANTSELVAILPVGLVLRAPQMGEGEAAGVPISSWFPQRSWLLDSLSALWEQSSPFIFGISWDEVEWRDWLALFSVHAFNYNGGWYFSSRVVIRFSSVQSLSCVRLFATPWITARQASLSITNTIKCSCWAPRAGEPWSCHLECPNADGFWQTHVHAALCIKLYLLLDRSLQSAPETFPTQGGVLLKISQSKSSTMRLLGFGSSPIHPSLAGRSALALGYMITIPLKPFHQAWGSGEAKETDQGWPQLVRGLCASKPFTTTTVRRASLERQRRKQQPTPVSLPGESHGQRSLVGYSP